MRNQDQPALATALQDHLLGHHGDLMDAQALTVFFKFPSQRAFRRCASRAELPVAVFRIPGRKGWFARTRDVARWLEAATADTQAAGAAHHG